ncbi:hypothetical protein [Rhizobium sp. AG855]|uniref:hypothetical protein n=1 Tax=Rhizobium sp. AG855 TaxID=2183898 RepID=UPI0011C3D65C|nr:hypothetical protein [Rhizobium sp. AG855]
MTLKLAPSVPSDILPPVCAPVLIAHSAIMSSVRMDKTGECSKGSRVTHAARQIRRPRYDDLRRRVPTALTARAARKLSLHHLESAMATVHAIRGSFSRECQSFRNGCEAEVISMPYQFYLKNHNLHRVLPP